MQVYGLAQAGHAGVSDSGDSRYGIHPGSRPPPSANSGWNASVK
jgi:hypothetical protein